MSIAEKLVTVAENVPKVFNAGQLSVISQSEALKGSASGEIISIKDISPVEHNVPCKVKSKNLLNAMKIASQNNNTDYVKDTENNSFTMRGNEGTEAQLYNTGQLMFPYTNTATISQQGIPVKAGKTYTLSFDYLLLEQGKYNSYIRAIVNWSNLDAVTSYDFKGVIGETQRYSLKFTASKDDMIGLVFRINNNYVTLSNIQVEEGSTATAYAPYIADISTVKVQRLGKNLCDGQLTQWAGHDTIRPTKVIRVKRNTNYTISVVGATNSPTFAIFGNNTGVLKVYEDKQIAWMVTTFNSGEYDYIWFRLIGENPNYNIDYDSKVQVEEGSTATEFEPYNSTEYTANADGTVEGIKSLYPTTTLMTDTEGVNITAEYIKDIDKTFNSLTTAVALTGGE